MKILILCIENPYQPIGGRGTLCRYQNPELHKLGAEIRYVSLLRVTEPTPWTCEVPHVNAIFRPNDHAYGDYCGNVEKVIVHCARMIAEGWRPDVIIAHDWDVYIPAARLREIFGIPVVAYFHLLQKEVELLRGARPDAMGQAPAAVEQQAIWNADAVIVVSNYLRDFIRDHYAPEIGGVPIHVVSNAVDFEGWANHSQVLRPEHFTPERETVIYCGRLAPEKGWESFVEAARLDANRQYIMIGAWGDEPENEPPNVRELRRNRENWFYAGYQTEDKIRGYMKGADYLVMPSLVEPWGIVALEAMAAGVPVITTRVGGLAEFCDNSNSVKIDPSGISILTGLSEARARREDLIAGGLATARSHSWTENARATLEIYRGIIR